MTFCCPRRLGVVNIVMNCATGLNSFVVEDRDYGDIIMTLEQFMVIEPKPD